MLHQYWLGTSSIPCWISHSPLTHLLDIEQTTLYDIMSKWPWCLSMKKTIPTKILVLITKGQLKTAQTWVTQQLSITYNQHIADKIDVTTLQHLTLHHLDKPILAAALTASTAKLCQRIAYVMASPPTTAASCPLKTCKPCPFDLIFKDKDFPPLASTPTVDISTTTATQSSTQSTLSATTMATIPLAFDYKAKLDWFMQEIETKLAKQFDTLYAQMNQ